MSYNTDLSQFNWAIRVDPPEAKLLALRDHLRAFNTGRARLTDGHDLAVFLHRDAGRLAAGISGWLWGEVLEIEYLWVSETLRGGGIGRKLLQILENEARERGGKRVVLDTFDFQAPDFYLRQGYEVFEVIKGFGEGHQKYFLRKNLNPG